MIDVVYPYSVTFLDFELSSGSVSGSVNSDYYSFVNKEWHRLLNVYGIPTIPDKYAGWWVPSRPDLDRIRVLMHIAEYATSS